MNAVAVLSCWDSVTFAKNGNQTGYLIGQDKLNALENCGKKVLGDMVTIVTRVNVQLEMILYSKLLESV